MIESLSFEAVYSCEQLSLGSLLSMIESLSSEAMYSCKQLSLGSLLSMVSGDAGLDT